MSDAKTYSACIDAMLKAARAWTSIRSGMVSANLPPDDTAIIGPLDDHTIGMIARNEYTRGLLKEMERAAEPFGGATFMQAVGILEHLGR